MIFSTLSAIIGGYVDVPWRRFFFIYTVISILIIFSLNFWGNEDPYYIGIAALFIPGLTAATLNAYLPPFSDLQVTVGSTILFFLIECPIIFTCFHIGRYLAAKTGNIHRL